MKTIFCLLLIIPALLSAQELKKVTMTNKNDYPKYKEVFYVLKKNPDIKHGSYTKIEDKNIAITGYYKNGLMDSAWIYYNSYTNKIESQGFYKNGLKDSTWSDYDYWGRIISTGSYIRDKRAGNWEFYNYKGEVEQVFDYTQQKIIQIKSDTNEYKVFLGKDTLMTKLDISPAYIGGSRQLSKFISENIKYPEKAMENNIQGKTYITFIIDAQGKTSEHKVIKGCDSECDAEALRVIKRIPNNWVPAILNGHPVAVEFTIPVNFKLY